MTCDRLFVYRATGRGRTLALFNVADDGTETPIDCTGCTAYMQVRTSPVWGTNPLIDTSTDTPPVGKASGMEWIDEANGELHVVWGEDDCRDTALFPQVKSVGWTEEYYCDVIVRDSDGVARLPPIPIPLTFVESTTNTP